MRKVDLKKELSPLYAPSASLVAEIEVPELAFLMIDGTGGPVSAAYKEAVETLFSLSYALKFQIKKSAELDHTVMPLESLWWSEEPAGFHPERKDTLSWTAMILQPDAVTPDLLARTRDEVGKKKKLPSLSRVRFERFHEGRAAQILHVGPYNDEPATIEKLEEFIRERQGTPRGRHHEIYLSDPNRTAPDKLKTILRQPFA